MPLQLSRAKGRRWVVLLATLLMVLLTARLGFWQLDRAAQKTRLQQAQEERLQLPALSLAQLPRQPEQVPAQLHRLALLQGRWLPAQTVYLENRQMQARPGFYAVTPLQLDDGAVLLVQRGWLPRDQADRTRIVAAPAPAGRVEVQGRIAPGPGRIYEFAGAASGPIRQNLGLDAYARETGLPLLPFSLVQQDSPNTSSDGLLRQWAAPAADVHKHYGYAFQWFALSALLVSLYAWFQLIRPLRQARR